MMGCAAIVPGDGGYSLCPVMVLPSVFGDGLTSLPDGGVTFVYGDGGYSL